MISAKERKYQKLLKVVDLTDPTFLLVLQINAQDLMVAAQERGERRAAKRYRKLCKQVEELQVRGPSKPKVVELDPPPHVKQMLAIDYALPHSFEELNLWFEYCAGKGQRITPDTLQRLVDEMRKIVGRRKYKVTQKLVDGLVRAGWVDSRGRFATGTSPPGEQKTYLQKLWKILRLVEDAPKAEPHKTACLALLPKTFAALNATFKECADYNQAMTPHNVQMLVNNLAGGVGKEPIEVGPKHMEMLERSNLSYGGGFATWDKYPNRDRKLHRVYRILGLI